MEIERINDHTVKFYISYGDIEDRGFDREEIWYNRDKSEELFWEMMDEVHQEEDFAIEGPLWIQVQALEKGLEILVTKAQVTQDGQRFELPIPEDKQRDGSVSDQIEEYLEEHFDMEDNEEDDILDFTMKFKNFEDLISLSKRFEHDQLITKLYAFENVYYLFVEFEEDLFEENDIENILSILLEYGVETQVTIHRLEEYGKLIMNENVFGTVRKYFL
ncbi:adaptor protein MecA [Jeotgalibacillus proteolyticus]|uniref:Adapter protein MecA n=1 Tax=Jeotgalibacillus proteolyticus TaxID=2082395 RepID=A0A2S5GH08_9BACL|nr:adaptor protein MecA [Jeotgalibacillus proteolyticus]PPA72327.1 adaptor protein MecA [Jeotgalibacillus proteolyticus]